VIYLLLAALAAVLALAVTPIVRAVAVRLGAVDAPGGRHIHEGHVPRMGGVALLAAGLGALTVAHAAGMPIGARLASGGLALGWLLAGALVIVAGGVIDDLRDIGPLPKLGVTALAALCAVAGHCAFTVVSNPFTGTAIPLGPLAGAVTLVWIVVVTNAFNLIDGLDGLAAGVGLIAAAAIFVVSIAQDRADAACLATVLGGVLFGFLFYNFIPASIFLGDSGSLLLGYLLSILSIQGRGKGPTAVVVLVPLLVLALPIMDVVVAVSRRYLLGGSAALFRADREHIHHRLLLLGLPPRRAVLLLHAVSAVFGGLAVLAFFARGPGSAVLVAVVAGASYLGLRQLGYPLPPRRAKSTTGIR
jgi:UDP-GlcNAc:undecaprenyl-phosphate GlcNAc-1-phosphate transferase